MRFRLRSTEKLNGWAQAIFCLSVVLLFLGCFLLPTEPVYRTVVWQQGETLEFPTDRPLYRVQPVLLSHGGPSFGNGTCNALWDTLVSAALLGLSGVDYRYCVPHTERFILAGLEIPLWLKYCSKLL